MSSNKSIFFLLIFSFMYLKMSKDSSAKYYQDNKEKRQYSCEQNRILSEDEKQKLA